MVRQPSWFPSRSSCWGFTGAAPPVAASTEDDLGARALWEGSWSTPVLGPGDQTVSGPVVPVSPPVPSGPSAEPTYYHDGCHALRLRTAVIPVCVYGDTDSDVRVAMVGESKVGRLFPALEEIALREGWALRIYTKSNCAFVDVPATDYPECDAFNEAVRADLAADPPDIVLTSALRRNVTDGYVRTWSWLENLGVEHVVALWDSPSPAGTSAPPLCVADAVTSGADLARAVRASLGVLVEGLLPLH